MQTWPPPTLLWPEASAGGQPGGDEVHVWAASLVVAADDLARLASMLSPYEKERASRFKFDMHRNRFIAGRGILRSLLASYLPKNAGRLDFAYASNGKPSLAAEFAQSAIHFNLAHSEDVALYAITRIGPVGVDVEKIRVMKNVEDLVARFFSTRESSAFQNVPAQDRPAAFFNLWTRKEAILKATGEGIGGALNLVEVSFLPGEPARVVAIAGDSAKTSRWTLQELSPAADFAAAVAIEAPAIRLCCRRLRQPAD